MYDQHIIAYFRFRLEELTCSYGLCYNRKDNKEDIYCRECTKAINDMYRDMRG